MTIIFDENNVKNKILKLSDDIISKEFKSIVLIGIDLKGSILAKRLGKIIKDKTENKVYNGTIDISLYKPLESNKFITIGKTDIPNSLKEKNVILVSTEINSGKSMHSALVAIHEHESPATIDCCCLIHKNNLTRPIFTKFIGEKRTDLTESTIIYNLFETDGEDIVFTK